MSEENSKELAIKTKAQKEFPDFTDSTDRLSIEELEKKLMQYANYREETELSKQKDEELNKAKERVKDLQAGYNETLKALKIKMAYIHLLMAEKAPSKNG